MIRSKSTTVPRSCLLLCLLWSSAYTLLAQRPSSPPVPEIYNIPDDATEQLLIERIRLLSSRALPQDHDRASTSGPSSFYERAMILEAALLHADALLDRFENTTHRTEVLMVKLKSLAALARLQPHRLNELSLLTRRLSEEKVEEPLASQSAYFAIQAFVLSARLESMTTQRMLTGSMERYQAFLQDYPSSEHVPIIRASLIRNFLALDRSQQAATEFKRLQRDFPQHSATRRARGELYRATSIGLPFQFSFKVRDGKTIRAEDYRGKVVLVHVWASRSKQAMGEMPELIRLHADFAERGLVLLGVNTDTTRSTFEKIVDQHGLDWPQHYNDKESDDDFLVAKGVVRIPTYFLVDRQGILRAINPSKQLKETVSDLLAEHPSVNVAPTKKNHPK